GDLGQHVVGKQTQVAGAIVAVLGWNGVSPEEGRHQLDWPLGVQLGDGFEALQFVRKGQAIATLDLDGRDAKFQESSEATTGETLNLAFRSRAAALYCGVDPPASGRDLLVGESLQALLELVLARAGKEQMRMAIDEAGQDRLAAGVDETDVGRDGGQRGRRANPGDLLPRDHDSESGRASLRERTEDRDRTGA